MVPRNITVVLIVLCSPVTVRLCSILRGFVLLVCMHMYISMSCISLQRRLDNPPVPTRAARLLSVADAAIVLNFVVFFVSKDGNKESTTFVSGTRIRYQIPNGM